MKVKVELESTPEELRHFLGLPNVAEFQHELMNKIRDNMQQGIAGFDALTLLKPFLPENLSALTSMQKQFWDSLLKNNHSDPKG